MPRIHFQNIALPRSKAKLLKAALEAAGVDSHPLGRCQTLTARVYGYESWAELKHAVSRIKPASDMGALSSTQVASALSEMLGVPITVAQRLCEAVAFDDVKPGMQSSVSSDPAAGAGHAVLATVIEKAYALGARHVSIGGLSDNLIEYRLPGRIVRDESLSSDALEGIHQFLAKVLERTIDSMPISTIIDGQEVRVRFGSYRPGRYWMTFADADTFAGNISALGIGSWEQVWRAAQSERGFLLICGPTMSGKSTTLAALYADLCDAGRPSKVVSPHLMSKAPFYRMLRGQARSENWSEMNEAGGAGEAVFTELRFPSQSGTDIMATAQRSLLVATCHASGPRMALSLLRSSGLDDNWLRENLCGILSQTIDGEKVKERRLWSFFSGTDEIEQLIAQR